MIFSFNYYSSVFRQLYTQVVQHFSFYYLLIMCLVLGLFMAYRFPYCYSPYLFICILCVMVFSCFMALFLRRMVTDYSLFFSGFVPVGTPLYICPLVCLAETVSYIIRPFVLVFRPFINVSLGCFGAVALSNFCLSSYLWLSVLVFIFFYEVFVALVHWFIVTNILDFSIDH
uniref:ATP synthase F0 subunit 6 n=1 Tax=Rhinebothrium sp. 1 TaxID=108307 RepID=A0A8K1W5I1_9CEST|nr:ATP synthase F0 subunit 6 [Rhinebothrium sp. 1]UFQ88650.1 ATP synthase F0 subunit 6 [Rhinebothrium sp. 1]UFQ88674.1 ATP synthase F0 subunit 6 [Rhinebothrium sp. 1]UFQ88686.1 ATP synthase F0 subunit 6 [Rhinebothrium sp. 1]UFQ88698.1 ATP synthase F0 subunit 6 [Rhinebothrium sp. 1]